MDDKHFYYFQKVVLKRKYKKLWKKKLWNITKYCYTHSETKSYQKPKFIFKNKRQIKAWKHNLKYINIKVQKNKRKAVKAGMNELLN